MKRMRVAAKAKPLSRKMLEQLQTAADVLRMNF